MTTVGLGLLVIFIVFLGLHLASVLATINRSFADRSRQTRASSAVPVSIVVPVRGIDNFIEVTLESSISLSYAEYEVIYCIASESDPAVPIVRSMIASHPGARAYLLIGDDRISANPKLNNIVKGWNAAAHDWIIIADSNVLMPRDGVQRLLALWGPNTGLVCSPPIGCRPQGFWAELECAFLNTYQARWQYLADTIGAGFAQGKIMLWRREVLARAGGIEALARELAEDAAATKVVRAQGLRVRLVDAPFGQPLGARRLADVWNRQVRWARLRRASFQGLFVGEVLSSALAPAACCAFLAWAADVSIAPALAAFLAVWYAAECLLARAAGWHVSALSPLAFVLRDLMLPAVWLSGWRAAFVWRGNAMRAELSPFSSAR